MWMKSIIWSLAGALTWAAVPARAALLLRYTFDETSSPTATANDSGTGTAAPGTLSGLATRTSSTPVLHSARALDLSASTGGTTDASSNYVTAGDVDKIDALTKMTVSFWLNLQADPRVNDRLFSDIASGAGWELRLGAAFGGGGSISASSFQFLFTADGTDISASSPGDNTGASNQWKFFALTYDGALGSNNLKIYEGTTAAAVTQLGATRSSAAGALDANAAAFFVGRSALTAADRTPPAFIDDVRIYDEILSAAALDVVRLENLPEPATALLAVPALWMALARRRRPGRG